MPTTVKVQLSEKNQVQLSAKTWDKLYTPVPNANLPVNLKNQLQVVYQSLTGNDLPQVGFTYLVRADGGTFKRVYSPSVYSSEDNQVIIRWGVEDIPLELESGKVSVPGNKKAKFSIREDVSGKYPETVLSVSINDEGVLYTMTFPFRFADWENPLSADALAMLLDEAPETIATNLAKAPDPNKKSESSIRLVGPIIKMVDVPVGSYVVTGFSSRDTQYGVKHLMQIVVDEPFVATTAQKNDAGEWVDVEVEVQGLARVKPTTAINSILSVSPIISVENPATLEVHGYGEMNGRAYAKAKLKVSSFGVDEDSVDLDFD